jgi:hypothetical protein
MSELQGETGVSSTSEAGVHRANHPGAEHGDPVGLQDHGADRLRAGGARRLDRSCGRHRRELRR